MYGRLAEDRLLIEISDRLKNLWDDPAHSDLQSDLMEFIHQRPDDIGPERTPVGMA